MVLAMGPRAAKEALFAAQAGVAKALASGRRAEIVDLLAQGERSVDDVAAEMDQSVANTSHHLRTLARAGLVETRRDGTRIMYRLAGDNVAQLWARSVTSPPSTSSESSSSRMSISVALTAWSR